MTDIPSSAMYPRFAGGGAIVFEEKAVPSAGHGQLVIQVKANALCASELRAYREGSQVTPGHEAAGVVASAGPGTSTPVGTQGVVFLMDFCGECRSCRLGLTNQCLAKRADYGFNRDGGYGPFMLVNENAFFAVGSDIPPAEATLLLDVMGTGGHSIERARLVHPDVQSLLITGSGPIGLGVLAMAKLTFGSDFPVLTTDIVPYRLDLSKRLGGLPVNVERESLREGMKRHGFSDVDMAVDSSGKSSARRDAMNALAKRGVLVCVGHGEDLVLNVSPDLIAPERAVIGSEYFCYGELAKNLERLRGNRGYLGQIVTHRYPVSEIAQAFKTFSRQNTGKVVVEQ
ncbi:MAG: alcohol dehydrogenase catalytic domain-containing protein [Planctomycetota bacterium]